MCELLKNQTGPLLFLADNREAPLDLPHLTALLGLDLADYTPSRQAFMTRQGETVDRAVEYHERGGDRYLLVRTDDQTTPQSLCIRHVFQLVVVHLVAFVQSLQEVGITV